MALATHLYWILCSTIAAHQYWVSFISTGYGPSRTVVHGLAYRTSHSKSRGGEMGREEGMAREREREEGKEGDTQSVHRQREEQSTSDRGGERDAKQGTKKARGKE
eukprot:2701886-Rhodomonas_salina.1